MKNERLITKLDHQIDLSVEKYLVELQLLQTIDGVGRVTAITLISEIGTDMSRFENEHHLASWSGLSPGTNETAGKKISSFFLLELGCHNHPNLCVKLSIYWISTNT